MCSGMFWRQFKALNRKNYIIFKRNKKAIIVEIIIPIIFVAILTSIGKITIPFIQLFYFLKL